jgi:hypothetical protein
MTWRGCSTGIAQGWINYYGRFCKSKLYPDLRRLNRHWMRWACQKYKRLTHGKRMHELAEVTQTSTLACLRTGGSDCVLTAGQWEPDEPQVSI